MHTCKRAVSPAGSVEICLGRCIILSGWVSSRLSLQHTGPARESGSPGIVCAFNSSLKGADGVQRAFHAGTGGV
jgi:hypothetical protein